MKNTIVIVILSLLFLMTTIGCNINNDSGTPTSGNPTHSDIIDETASNDGEIYELKEITSSFIEDFIADRVYTWIEGLVAADLMSGNARELTEMEIPNIDFTIVSQTEHEVVIEARYHLNVFIGAQTIESDDSNAHMNIEPQTLEWDLFQTVEFVKVESNWIVDNFYDGATSEKLENELANIQAAIDAMMSDTGVTELDAEYISIYTEVEVKGVTSGNGSCSLDQYHTPFKYPYSQPYNITKGGTVTASLSNE